MRMTWLLSGSDQEQRSSLIELLVSVLVTLLHGPLNQNGKRINNAPSQCIRTVGVFLSKAATADNGSMHIRTESMKICAVKL